MTGAERDLAGRFDQLLRVWETGHMLHLVDGVRNAAEYPAWIARWRESNPRTLVEVTDQSLSGSKLWMRLVARRPDGSSATGINESRFEGERIAEEWAAWSSWR